MNAEYKRDLHHSYLILTPDTPLETESYGVRMLTGNSVPGILPCRVCAVDGDYSIYYEITSCQEVSAQYESKQFREKDLKRILEAVIQVLENLKEFLLPSENLLLCPEYMFERGGKEICFCYLPGYSREIQRQLREFMEYLLPKLYHGDPEAVAAGYGVYKGMMEEGWSLERMKEDLYSSRDLIPESSVKKQTNVLEDLWTDEMEEEDEAMESDKEKNKKQGFPWRTLLFGTAGTILILGVMTAGYYYGISWIWPETLLFGGLGLIFLTGGVSIIQWRVDMHRNYPQKEEKEVELDFPEEEEEPFLPEEETEYSFFFGYQSEDENCEETVMMYHVQKHPQPVLVPETDGEEEWFLRGELAMIGKMKKSVDVCLPYPTISRIHAKIRKDGEDYFLSDLHSRNGTKYNGRMLNEGEEVLLHPEDCIEFADHAYRFRLKEI
ncbi:MAG: DUF6382 domain-containing protein [Eubacteriales bacterium]|nr:DUF6382 domain-containing protein [Eubacteriales bacterium]